jgi:NTE family protein
MSPSSEFGEIAAALSNRIPRIVGYLMRGLGPDESTVELASYLLFDASFCGRLIDLGKADVAAREEEIRAFFQRSPGAGRRGS